MELGQIESYQGRGHRVWQIAWLPMPVADGGATGDDPWPVLLLYSEDYLASWARRNQIRVPVQKALAHAIACRSRQGQQAKACAQQVEEGGLGKGGQGHGRNRNGSWRKLAKNLPKRVSRRGRREMLPYIFQAGVGKTNPKAFIGCQQADRLDHIGGFIGDEDIRSMM